MLPQRVSLIVLSLGFAAAASAQDMIGLSNIYSSSVFQQGVIAMGKPTLEAGQKRAYSADTKVSLDALEFSTSGKVESATRRKIFESLSQTTSDPAMLEELRKSVDSDAVWNQFDRLLRSFGYSSDNLADVMTAYYVINWEVVNGEDATRHPDGIRAINRALTSTLAASPELQAMSDAEKQEAAEIMAYMATIAGAAKNELRDRGDGAGLADLQSAIRQTVLKQGIDLARLQLTDQGFVSR